MPPQNKKQGRDYPLSPTPEPSQKSIDIKYYDSLSNKIKKDADAQNRRGDSLIKAGYANKSVVIGKTKNGETKVSITGNEAKQNAKAMYKEASDLKKLSESLKRR